MDNLAGRIHERLTLLKEERQRRFTELAQFDAVIAELEQLLAPAAPAVEELPVEVPAIGAPNGRSEPTPHN